MLIGHWVIVYLVAVRSLETHPLFVLQESLKVDNWNDNINPCSWDGVYCDWDNEISAISATNFYFTGDLTNGVFSDLPKLEYFSISNTLYLETQLTIPSDICSSNSLKHFEIFNFSISSFPSQLLKCTNLEILSLTYCDISGQLPDFSSLTKLKILELDHNQISGSIPQSLSSLKNIEIVHLFNNQLSGALPDFASNNLQILDVRENQLSGTVSVFNI